MANAEPPEGGQKTRKDPHSAIAIGDFICLYNEELQGYATSYQSSSAHNHIVLVEGQMREAPKIPNIHTIAFQVVVPFRYKCAKLLRKLDAQQQNGSGAVGEPPGALGSAADVEFDAAGIGGKMAALRRAAVSESADNVSEQRRQNGKQLLYGQVIQLRHAFNNKFVHVNPVQTSVTELSNMAGGALVRLYHREVEGYLSVENLLASGACVHLRVRTSRPNNVLPSSSAIYYWQIEKSSSIIDGGTLLWNDSVRLRHAVTRQYLAVVNAHLVMTDLDDSEDNDNREALLFRFHPITKKSDVASAEFAVRIEHVASGMWLHGDPTKDFVPPTPVLTTKKAGSKDKSSRERGEAAAALATIPYTSAIRRHVDADAEMRYEDAFSIQLVDHAAVLDMNYAAGAVPFLHKAACEISEGGPTATYNQITLLRLETAVFELRQWLFVHGVPTKSRQKLLRNFNIVDICVSLLKCRIRLLGGTLAGVQAAITSSTSGSLNMQSSGRMEHQLEPLFSSLVTLLDAYLVGESRKNEMYLGRHLELFLNQIEESSKSAMALASTQMTVELLRNNRALVDRIRCQFH